MSSTTPQFSFPMTFDVGGQQTEPLINVAQLRGHLVLLDQFVQLQSKVDALNDLGSSIGHPPDMPRNKDTQRKMIIGLAVERFSIWCLSMKETDAKLPVEEILPPVDVLMVWHAYMLNPARYAEDCARIPALKILKLVGTSLFTALDRLSEILRSPPSRARITGWISKTQRMFDPLEDAAHSVSMAILCPKCRSPIEAPEGYLDEGFAVVCKNPDCTVQLITKDTLAIRKLAEDLVRDDGTYHSCLAGTLHAPEKWDSHHAKLTKDAFMRNPCFERPASATEEEWIVSIMEKNDYKLETMKRAVGDLKWAERIFSAYVDHRMFSEELVNAVIRQASFVEKMRDLHWTEPNYFDEEEHEVVLLYAIARYHALVNFEHSGFGFRVDT